VDGAAGLAEFTFAARGVVVGEDSAADGEAGVFGFEDDTSDFVADDMGNFFVHVPRHEFAGAEAACLRLDQEAAFRA
jgi:hypothetical protein